MSHGLPATRYLQVRTILPSIAIGDEGQQRACSSRDREFAVRLLIGALPDSRPDCVSLQVASANGVA